MHNDIREYKEKDRKQDTQLSPIRVLRDYEITELENFTGYSVLIKFFKQICIREGIPWDSVDHVTPWFITVERDLYRFLEDRTGFGPYLNKGPSVNLNTPGYGYILHPAWISVLEQELK